jgi:hypothetical protein
MEDEKCQEYIEHLETVSKSKDYTEDVKCRVVKSKSPNKSNSVSSSQQDEGNTNYITLANDWSDVKLNLQKKKASVVGSVTGSLFSSSKLPAVVCKIHGKDSITVDTTRFCIICTQCIEEGRKGNFLENINDIDEYEDDTDTMCKAHSDIPGVFYCDDCKYFICKLCFANNHRSHNSNILNLIGEDFKQTVRSLIAKYNTARPKIEEAYNGILGVHQNIKKARDESLKRVKNMIANVIGVNKNVSDGLMVKLKTKFLDIDNETEDAYNRLILISKKLNKFLNDLEDIARQAGGFKDPIALCSFKKSKAGTFNEIKMVIGDCKQLLDYKIDFLKNQVNENTEAFKRQLVFFNKQTAIFEKSILTSIKSGVSNSTYVLRRFTKFSSKGLKYYKTSSVLVTANTGVYLSGVGLCGGYINSEKRLKGDYTSEHNINFTLAISEIASDGTAIQKVNEKHKMCSIVNRYDPLSLVYLKKGIYLKQGVTYMISITNQDNNSYIDIWTGECAKKYLETMNQKLVCNCTGVEFDLKPAKDVESDLNEFNSGVLGSLIYSFTKAY